MQLHRRAVQVVTVFFLKYSIYYSNAAGEFRNRKIPCRTFCSTHSCGSVLWLWLWLLLVSRSAIEIYNWHGLLFRSSFSDMLLFFYFADILTVFLLTSKNYKNTKNQIFRMFFFFLITFKNQTRNFWDIIWKYNFWLERDFLFYSKLTIGSECLAKHDDDGVWYRATVEWVITRTLEIFHFIK